MSKHEDLAGICINLTYISTPITSEICSECSEVNRGVPIASCPQRSSMTFR